MSSTTDKKTAARKPEPPQAAVAQDAHWSATRERLRNRVRPTATLTICDDHQAKKARAEAEVKLRYAQANRDEDPTATGVAAAVAAAQAAMDTAQAAFDEAAIVLRFQALPRPEFEALKRAHPATEEQAEEGNTLNIETFAPELIAASSLDGITEEEAREYLDTWSEGEAAALFQTAFSLQGETRLDVGKG